MIPEMVEERMLLASASPRRHQLMREAGYPFEVITLDVDESYAPSLKGSDIPEHLARMKSRELGPISEEVILLTADTMVFLDEKPMGKPGHREEALEMLSSLSGRSHEVITGVCIRKGEEENIFHSRTTVHFRDLEEEEMTHYVDRFRPFDKAGAYGIQEWIGHIGVDRIEGSFFNVMGLPIEQVHQRIKSVLQSS